MASPVDPREWVVVMPSIRTINLDYLAPIPEAVKVLVVDDSNGSISANRPNMDVYRYDDYRKLLGDDEQIIPRKTDTCRSFGFYLAWKQGYKYIVTLDDDCLTHPGFLEGHSLVGQTQTLKSVDVHPWYNTLDNLALELNGEPSPRFYARGFPYRYRLVPHEVPSFGKLTGRVVCNMGMWLKVPDINGLDKIGKEIPDGVALKEGVLAMGKDTNFSLCIMNVGFLAEVVPAFYQLPMNIDVCNAKLDRFGDIWSGYILKRLTDIRGDVITIGNPAVTHTKAGNTVRETQVEHFGHLLENYFYDLVDEAAAATPAADYAQMYHRFSTNFLNGTEKLRMPRGYKVFFAAMGEKMVRWSQLFLKK